ncbi:MAG: cation-translocating P-type ATPase [Saprospiraceae bacterium]|nr:cation-translocating P-type ATPase [Saprospiraceae bacterium]
MDSSLQGLNEIQVRHNREKFGSNIIENQKGGHFFKILVEIISEPMFLILVITSVLYFVLGEFSEGLIMLIAIFLVAGISLFQENRSRNAVDSLKKLSNPKIRCMRNGIDEVIDTEELVVDDIFYVEDGDIIPADGFIIDANDFSVNESMLTGESLPVFKNALAVSNNIFKGSMVESGYCKAIVTSVGVNTAMGKIGKSLDSIINEKTPLQQQIRSFTKSMVAYGVIAFLLVWGMNYFLKGNLIESLLQGLTLAMSVLPEEIPVAFSTFMALGAYHLYKKRVIVRTPYTVEVLGAATVICTDKTGTLTENNMEIVSIYDFQNDILFDFTKVPPSSNDVLTYAMWASEPSPFDNMEKAIHHMYGHLAEVDLRPGFSMHKEYPLSGNPPMMTHVWKDDFGNAVIAVKGSMEKVLSQCDVSTLQLQQINQCSTQLANKGYRVLCVANSDHNIQSLPDSQNDFKYNLLGLIAFYDPPKKNINGVLNNFYKAGVDIKMITGDLAGTAVAIGKQVGIKNSEIFMTGDELVHLSEDQLRLKVKDINIFARMFPDAKLRLIEALKSNGEVVAMTGDGVNDSPALKSAHIGIAMGKGGSEVAKNAASIILMDDDLKWMVDAIALGRRIYENLKKAIRYIISIHIPVILIVALPLFLYWKYSNIFTPVHVIFLELIMGPTCSIIFENEPIEKNSMNRPPRKMGNYYFSFKELLISIIQGLAITISCLALGYYYMETGGSESLVRTVIYTTLIFSNVFLTLVNRSFYFSFFKTIRYKNHLIPLVILISLLILILAVSYTPVRNVFGFEVLSLYQWFICFGAAFIGVFWMEVYKYFFYK